MIIKKIKNIDDTYFDVFMSISEALTGFRIYDLQATGLEIVYYQYISNHLSDNSFFQFLQDSRALINDTNIEKSLPMMLNVLDEKAIAYKSMSDKIITLWYNGTWEGVYVDDNSYKEGLIWKAIHSHPPGAKQPGFKSWSINPEKENL